MSILGKIQFTENVTRLFMKGVYSTNYGFTVLFCLRLAGTVLFEH